MKWASLKSFSHYYFIDNFFSCKSSHTDLENFPIVYRCLLSVERNNRAIEKFVILCTQKPELVYNMDCRTVYHAPLFTKHHIFALLPSNGKGFTLNDKCLKPELLWSSSSTDAAADYHQIRDADCSIQIFS